MGIRSGKRPNILYICSDSHGYPFSGHAGHPLVKTPNLDRIAESGVVFSSAYCGNPVCAPARASLMTGMYASDCNSFCNSTVWDGGHPTWARRLRDAGYRCRASGVMDLHSDFDTGFEEIHPRGGHSHNPDITSLFRRPPCVRIDARKHVDGGPRDVRHRDADLARDAVAFLLREAPSLRQPWVYYAGFVQPHPSFIAFDPYYSMYPLNTIDLPKISGEGLEDLHPVYQELCHATQIALPIPEDRIRRARAGYYGKITELDEYVGQIWDALAEAGLLEDTWLVYTSDHGESLGEHGLWFKSNFYENAVHVPMLIAGAGVPKGGVVETPVAHVDLAATMLDVAGVEIPGAFRGRSLLSLMEGRQGSHPGFAFSECHSHGHCTGSFMIRKGPWKYLHFTWFEDLLFNLADDPGEFHNLIGRPEMKSVEKEMRDILRSQIDPEAVTREAFKAQDQVLKKIAEGKTEEELAQALDRRVGSGFARMLAYRVKS